MKNIFIFIALSVLFSCAKKEDADVANQTITMIREASLTKSTSQELKEWNEWLKINNMYEEHAV